MEVQTQLSDKNKQHKMKGRKKKKRRCKKILQKQIYN